jgi:hypothetical protein
LLPLSLIFAIVFFIRGHYCCNRLCVGDYCCNCLYLFVVIVFVFDLYKSCWCRRLLHLSLFLSCLVLSCLVLSCLAMCCLSCLALPSPCVFLPCLVWSFVVSAFLASSPAEAHVPCPHPGNFINMLRAAGRGKQRLPFYFLSLCVLSLILLACV